MGGTIIALSVSFRSWHLSVTSSRSRRVSEKNIGDASEAKERERQLQHRIARAEERTARAEVKTERSWGAAVSAVTALLVRTRRRREITTLLKAWCELLGR